MMKTIATNLFALFLASSLGACSSDSEEGEKEGPEPSDVPAHYDPGTPYSVDIDAADLTPDITHTLFPVPVGATWSYKATKSDGVEEIEVSVEPGTKAVWGAEARIVRDTVTLDGELIEDTCDWYAQDDNGNVWYLGEDTTEYEDGVEVCKCGAWESGVDNALPGVNMQGLPKVGQIYRQEYYAGEAEDIAEIVSLDETVTVPAGTFEHCLKVKEGSAIEPYEAFKYYCPGVGLTLEEEDGERVELIASSLVP
jgi:hypothetical protein